MASGEDRQNLRISSQYPLIGFVTGLFAGFLVFSLVCCIFYRHCCNVHCETENDKLEGIHTAHLLLNHTGFRQDDTLQWQGDPSLGRSFLYGLILAQGSLQTQRSGIYSIYVQVTLAECVQASVQGNQLGEVKASTLTIGILSAQSRHSSLLRRHFQGRCSLSASLQVNLSHQDTLYVNLTHPIKPSPNADETFFGVSWLRPSLPVEYE
ncbi:CD70 antigen [Monodelphis domestica]|uniref:CD70 antigen n=1 Tax=Monodelphis domestica TaxID=13616 RepID=UPI0000F2C75F|nr:CD70 antigen [Monodelphis domestica]